MTIHQRKDDHIRINLEEDVGFLQLTTGLEQFHFVHQALPEVNLHAIDSSVTLFGKRLRAPILVSSMTGGAERAEQINRNLAEAAQEWGLAMGVGSQRAAIANLETAKTFCVRSVAPDLLLFANLGAIQLNYGFGVDECRRAVEMIEADALILHLNPLQEVFQMGGDTQWRGLLDRIALVCAKLGVPVIAKEVGWGFAEDTARRLIEAGVAAIDVAGAGGTSWSQVEMYRAKTEVQRRVAATFVDWGIPTSEAIQAARQAGGTGFPIIASGGLRNGLDIAKCIALGANMGGMAGPFLKAAVKSLDAVLEQIEITQTELRVAMFGIGAATIEALQSTDRLKKRR